MDEQDFEVKNDSDKIFIIHKIIEISGLKSQSIWNQKSIMPMLKEFSKKMKLNILKESYHDFHPQGTTIVFVLSNSHLAVHTWPEFNYLHIDLVTCSHIPENEEIKKFVNKIFNVSENQIKIREIDYGY